MMTFRLPFLSNNHHDMQKLVNKTKHEDVKNLCDGRYSDELCQLTNLLLSKREDDRPKIRDFIQ